MYKLIAILLSLLVMGCAASRDAGDMAAMTGPDMTATSKADSSRLAAVLAAQPAVTQARYTYRHPQETLGFFGIEPGMTVVEALPGRGWYSRILLEYLGPDGRLIGADYSVQMYPLFGFFPPEFIEQKKTWPVDWPEQAEQWRDSDSATVTAFAFGSAPPGLAGTADAVLFIRALHNLNRFEPNGAYLTTALGDAYRLLKPGGVVGVVQHQSNDHMPDDWADGSRGYLKTEALIRTFESAGFEFVVASDINANPKDQPTEEDVVWRLPPTYLNAEEGSEQRAQVDAVGESNRMTLKFIRP